MTITAEVVALIAAAGAVFAAVLAVRATALVARTVIAHGEGPSPRDPLTVRVTEGQTRRDIGTDTRDYTFKIVASSALPTEWRCEAPTLRVTYRTRANFLGAVDIRAAEPLIVPGGAATNATLRFTTSNVIPRHCRIDAYTMVLTSDIGGRICIDASLPAVLEQDADGTGPPTWGWD